MQSLATSPKSAATPSSHNRVSELDGVRGIAILLVLGFHFIPATGPLHFLAFLFQIGWTGVDLFFVLSGYLITGILLDSVGRPSYYRNFIVRRTLRIFPVYFLSLAICAILTYWPGPIRWKDFFSAGGWWYVSYLGNFQVAVQNGWPALYLLTPLWSLQIEEQFYLSFPFIVKAAKRKTLAMILFGSVLGALALRTALALAMPKTIFAAYVLMPCRMDALAMGGLIAIARREAPEWLNRSWIPWATGLCAGVFVLICAIWKPSPWSVAMRTVGYTALDLACAGVLVMLIAMKQRRLVALCRLRILVWIGTISYGLYLLHVPAANVERRLLPNIVKLAPNGSAELLASVAAGIAAAAFSWWLFESPILRLKERFTVRT